ALFRTREEWTEVDAWPDRPAVIFGEKAHSDALIEIFGEKAFHSGKSVARSVSKLKQEGRVFQPPRSSGFAGEIEIEGHRLSWNLDPAGGAGSLVVLRGGRVYFEENVAGLP